jgi:hypothetical protein
MGRNTRTRSHRYISSGKRAAKRSFNWKGLENYSNHLNKIDAEKVSIALNGALLIMPWAVLFAIGALA